MVRVPWRRSQLVACRMPWLPGRPGRTVAPGSELLAVDREPALPVPESVPWPVLLVSMTVDWFNPPTLPVTSSVPSRTRNRPTVNVPGTVSVPAPTLARSMDPFVDWSGSAAPSVPEKVLSVSSKPTNRLAFVPLLLMTVPAPDSDPRASVRPFVSKTEPVARSSRPPDGSASPIALIVAWLTDVVPRQTPLCSWSTEAFAIVPCASKPEIDIAPAARTGTCTESVPRADREMPVPRRTSELAGRVPACNVTFAAVDTASVEMTRVPSRVMVPPAPSVTSAVPSSGGATPPDQLPPSLQRPVPAAPVQLKGEARALNDSARMRTRPRTV